jgi:hypothetical protein
MAAGVQMRNFQKHPICVARHAFAMALVALAAACGSGAGAASAPAPPAPPALSRAALPASMDMTTTALGVNDLVRDAPIDGFADRLQTLGYESGQQREFRGPSHTFSTVVSRSLLFKDAAGAHGYVQLVADGVAEFFGKGSKLQPLTSNGRSGYLITAAPCGCHLETPILVAVVSKGDRVTWLYGTGRGARPPALRALLQRAP